MATKVVAGVELSLVPEAHPAASTTAAIAAAMAARTARRRIIVTGSPDPRHPRGAA
jgi:hypothetical protein